MKDDKIDDANNGNMLMKTILIVMPNCLEIAWLKQEACVIAPIYYN